jgi:hypothetical protein
MEEGFAEDAAGRGLQRVASIIRAPLGSVAGGGDYYDGCVGCDHGCGDCCLHDQGRSLQKGELRLARAWGLCPRSQACVLILANLE